MKKQLLLLVLTILPMAVMADAVEINGIYYNIIEKAKLAEVTTNPYKYNGNIVIPEVIEYVGMTYCVTSVGEYAFSGCSGLTSVTIPNSVMNIKDNAFSACSGLTSIEIPNSVTSIGYNAFYNCNSLTSISFGNNLITIGIYAFDKCTSLTSITLPSNLLNLGTGSFQNCSGLISVSIPNSVTNIGSWAFSNCKNLISVTIPNSLTTLDNGIFENCISLTSVTIPNNVTSIGDLAFSGCSGLTSITIGNKVSNIDYKAFANCKKLTDFYCYSENVPTTEGNVFENSYIEYATLHVPNASIAVYSNTAPWSQFGTKVGLSDGEMEKCEKPTISYQNGKLTFKSATDGAICKSNITDTDITSYSGNEVQLSVTYYISVYATKEGYDDSDVANATLCWIDKEPQTEGITNGVASIPAKAVLIQSNGGQLTIDGAEDGTLISIYSINGTEAGKAVSRNGSATVNTNLQPGNVAIIKIGEKSVKMVVK